MQLKIREKSIALFVLCAMVPLGVVSVGSYIYSRDALRDFVEAELTLVTRDALNRLEQQFSEALVDLKSWSKLRVMQDVLIEDEENEIDDELANILEQYPFYAKLLVVNKNGTVIAATRAEYNRMDLSGTEVFAVTRRGETFQGQIAQSTVVSKGAPVFAFPITANYDHTTVIGALIGVVDWKYVTYALSMISMAGASQDANHLLVLEANDDNTILYETPSASGTLSQRVLAAHSEEEGIIEVASGGINYVMSREMSHGYGEFSNPHWKLYAAVSTNVAYASAVQLRKQALIVGILAGIIAIAIGWFGANSLVHPMTSIIATLKLLAAGKNDVEITNLNRNDEIGSMAQALEVFKDVTVKLKQSNKDLHRNERKIRAKSATLEIEVGERIRAERALTQAHAELERRVEDRTKELQESNCALNQEMTERKHAEETLLASEHNLRIRIADLEKAHRKLELQGEDLVRLADDLLIARDEARAADRAKSEFLAAMSHELRTPLNAVIGFSAIIKDETFGPVGSAKYRDYAGDINESGEHLLGLINDILDLSKIESGTDELHEDEIEIPEIVRATLVLVEQRAQQSGIKIGLELADQLPALRADERKLKQILVNLLANAVKFIEFGGEVMLRVWCGKDSGYVFQIADTGIGIASEDIPKALSQFGQVDGNLDRQYDGTGLGLSLTKALVELHGGSLELQSQVGVGTTVTVRFPAERIADSTARHANLG